MTDEFRALVGRAAGYDPDAWEDLFRRSYSRLYSYARRRLYDDQAADDVASETMTRALDNISGFTWGGGGFDAWLYGIARNIVHEHMRVRQRQSVAITVERPTLDRGPEERVMAGEQAAIVRSVFDGLSADDQEVLELRVQGGLSSEEVARLTGKRPGAVRMAQARALQRMRSALEEVDDAF